MTEDEMSKKMGLSRWNAAENRGVAQQLMWVGTRIFAEENKIDVDVRTETATKIEQVGLLLTPDEAEAFGLRLVAAAGMVRARQTTKEETSNE